MSEISIPTTPQAGARLSMSPLGLAAVAVLVAFCADAAGGFRMLAAMGSDNDSQMRLVQVRDLLAGQGWYDLHQYRLGMAEGSSMHWSRLVDAPIAALIWITTGLTGDRALGETVAMVLWPALTFMAALWMVVRIARRFAGVDAMVPAVVIGAISLYMIGIFGPGQLDHHNIELALTLAMLAFLLESIDRPPMALLSGVAATLALAIGMETAGYVGFAGIAVACWYLFKGREASRQTVWFGAGFSATAFVALVAAKPPSSWLVAECDAFSVVQFSVALVAGAGIALVAGSGRMQSTLAQRAIALGLLGVVLVGLLVGLYPQCLAAPYSEVTPRLREYWMGSIAEAQPIWTIVQSMPIAAANYYPPILVALLWLCISIVRRGLRVEDAFVLTFLGASALVSFYQLRGANFALGFAAAPLAAMVATQRVALARHGGLANNLRVVGAWLVSINLVWMVAASLVVDSLWPGQAQAEDDSLAGDRGCVHATDFDALASMEPSRIVAIANLGASILRHTHHHVFAAPYHRNVDGNVLALDILSANPEDAATLARDNGVDLLVACRGNSESDNFRSGSLQAALNAGQVPSWLTPVQTTVGANLEIYRLRPE